MIPHARDGLRWWRATKWAWAVGALLAWQLASLLWSDGGGWWMLLDAAGVLAVVTALGLVAGRPDWRRALIPVMVWVALFSALLALVVFYLLHGRSLGGERLRLPWIHGDGLNAVLTGLLCAAGAVAALGEGARGRDRFDRVVCLAAAGCCVFAVLATRSRGALLALLAGAIVLAWFERRRLVAGLLAAGCAAGVYFVILFSGGGEAAALLERGAAGRMDIYLWFLGRMGGMEWIAGAGAGTAAVIAEDQLGWFVEHPHSAYLTQLYLTGGIGLALLLVVLGGAAWRGLREAAPADAVWLALLATGAMGVLFDTSLIFSLLTTPRLEPVLVLLPAVMALHAQPSK
ncbi:MAG: hypothetical protein HKN82_11215 [Akkermansiaceae bacterium]|nr:hypothetical protein [Akkermansiaceae bacterium]